MLRACLTLICLFCCTVPAWPLKFKILGEGNRKILFVYDCDLLSSQCEEYENEFMPHIDGDSYEGDPAVFRRNLREPGLREVWIISGGGVVGAAFEMARDLRNSHLPVRVPTPTAFLKSPPSSFRSYCVSACTVFFMGGVIRRIDPGTTYQVHSASRWLTGVEWQKDAPSRVRDINPDITKVASDPDRELPKFAEGEQRHARIMALQMLRLFQNTLLFPTRRPPVSEDYNEIREDAETRLPALSYRSSAQEDRDVRRIKAEGRAAVQDIMMRLEREQMASAIHWLESRSDLGHRADSALEMLRMMYIESIQETSTLTESELERRGYVTPEVH